MRSFLFILALFGSLYTLSAQTSSRNSDCFGSSLLTLNFEAVDDGGKKLLEPHYSKKDRFTFWYRIQEISFDTINLAVSGTNPKDIYDVSLYRYDGEKVCKELVHGDRSPLSIGSLQKLNTEAKIKGHHPVAFQDQALKKGATYYLSVMHVGGKGCGHIALFRADGKKIEARAKARDCFKVPKSPDQENDEEKPEELSLTTGLLDSAENRSIAGEIMVMDRETGKKRFIELDEDSAQKVKLHQGRTYRFKGEALGYHSKLVEKELASDTSFFLRLSSLDKGEKIILRRIYFHPNTYAFRDQSRSSLRSLYKYMKERSKARIEIQGHTASDQRIDEINPLYKDKAAAWKFTGTAEELSRLRARAVKEKLVEMGIGKVRMQTKGLGASRKLVKDPRSQRQEQKNMRVEIRILK